MDTVVLGETTNTLTGIDIGLMHLKLQ